MPNAAAISRRLAAAGFPRDGFRDTTPTAGFHARRGLTCPVVVTWHPPDGADTAERLTEIAAALAEAGYRCELGARCVRVLGWGEGS